MSEMLCRIDRNHFWNWMKDGTTKAEINDYITAHAVPENQATVLSGGWGELTDFLHKWPKDQAIEDLAQAILDRFGIPWDKAPEWAKCAKVLFMENEGDKCYYRPDGDDFRVYGKATTEMYIPRPAPSLEERREKAKADIDKMDVESLKKLGY